MEMSKRLAGVAIAVSSVAFVTGCSSTKSSEASLYSEPVGATPATSSQKGSSYAIQSQTSTSTSTSASTQSAGAQELKGDISIPLYEEQLAVGTRMVESGSVRLRKQVTTETVNQPVQIRRETLVVDREAGTGSQATSQQTAATAATAGTFTPFEQGEIVIKLHKEEPVVEKRVIATGRVTAKTATDTEQVTVSREVRKENIDVEKIGNPQNVTISDNVGARASDAVGGTGTSSGQVKGSQSQDKGSQTTDPAKQTPPPEQK